MLAIINSGTLGGVRALPVDVEISTGEMGEFKIILVGLPDTAVRESQNRVVSALQNTGFELPVKRLTINLAPGNLRKEGPLYDLPIALGIMAASGQINNEAAFSFLSQTLVAGELGLAGHLRPIRGGLALARMARDRGLERILLPIETAREAYLVEGIQVVPVNSLDQAVRVVNGELPPPGPEAVPDSGNSARIPAPQIDFSDVRGQFQVRRAVEVAVAGGHNILFIGPPGSGKSMIARRIPTILPSPSTEVHLEILEIYSAAGLLRPEMIRHRIRPFRAPHHTISDVGLVGGGSVPGPGELSLAHEGVLFLDELPEFRRSALEVLRQPLEDGEVTLSRSAGKVTFPARVMLVAAMNPSPSGYEEGGSAEKFHSPHQIARYRAKVSGPLLDRIDIQVEAPGMKFTDLHHSKPGESSKTLRERIEEARLRQNERYLHTGGPRTNAHISGQLLRTVAVLEPALLRVLEKAMEQLGLSARAHDKILRVARTIADLEGAEAIALPHLTEAISYRSLDRGRNPREILSAAPSRIARPMVTSPSEQGFRQGRL